ncbi:unnamed protein product (macronuclear) [Paramecium tetraurelia]|uniref:SET domain-containing protein n=1 Tax=Paramecium tetraurelia TaxID=5888 RepID=A0E7K5_PARTE|nr:uncharacterized protein GSPATT00024000001 [Paramecium tetraurelia]CAK91272.1 unnamed protein product [Paramecium tetraurelia]|eukprot:XP_001458669.1 hypothetical protein (macronuclear) [Paramecium tetraurelia strain d4-2]
MADIPAHVLAIQSQKNDPPLQQIEKTPKLPIQEMKLIDVEELMENKNMNNQYIVVQVYQIDWKNSTQYLIVRDFNEIWLNLTILQQNRLCNYQINDWLIVKNPKLIEFGIFIQDSQDVVAINQFTYQALMNSEIDQTDPAQLKETGNQYFKLQQYRLAYEAYSMVIKYEHANKTNLIQEQCYNNRAQCLFQLGYIQEAVNDLNQVLQLNPQNEKAIQRQALCYLKLQNPNDAKKLLESLPNHKTDKDIVFKLVECELMIKHLSGNFDLISLLNQYVNQDEFSFEKFNNFKHKSIERKKSNLGGLGLFVNQPIPKGTLLVVEHPMHKIKQNQTLGMHQRDDVYEEIRQQAFNNKQFAEQLFNLYDGTNNYSLKHVKQDFEYQLQNYVVDLLRIESIFRYNAHAFQLLKVFTKNKQIKYLDQSEGLWFTLSQVNHSLTPNIFYYFLGELLIVVSAKNIEKDEEILVQYHPPLNQKEYQNNLKSHNIPLDQKLVQQNQLWKMDEQFNEIKTIIKTVKTSKSLNDLTTYTLSNPNVIQQIKEKYPIKYLKIIQQVSFDLFQVKKIKEYLDLKFQGLVFQFDQYPQCSTIQDFFMFLTVVSQGSDIEKEMVNFIFRVGILMFGEAFLKNQNSEDLLFQLGFKQIKK